MLLIWRNCCTYNQEGAEIYTLGKKLSDQFESRFREVESLSSVCSLPLISSSIGQKACVGFSSLRVENRTWRRSGHSLTICSSCQAKTSQRSLKF